MCGREREKDEREREGREVESEGSFERVIAMTWSLDVFGSKGKSLADPKVFPVSQASLITHKAVTSVFKGRGKQEAIHTSVSPTEDLFFFFLE